jgi:alkaline phosphatase
MQRACFVGQADRSRTAPMPSRLAGVHLRGPAQATAARNVMLFIADGASWGTWHMASYYEHGALGRQPYDRFSVKLGMTTNR